jgi:hypothetical protein
VSVDLKLAANVSNESLLRDILKKIIQQFYHNESWSFGEHAQYAQLACVRVIVGTQPGYAYVSPEVAGKSRRYGHLELTSLPTFFFYF